MLRASSPFVSVALVSIALAGCEDKNKMSEQAAVDLVAPLSAVVKDDVEQVRRGVPEVATKLTKVLDDDTLKNPQMIQRALAGARADNKDFSVSKITFFAFAEPSGVVLRSEGDPDFLASRSMIEPKAFPALKKALDPAGSMVELYGEMKELRGVKNGADLAWVVGHPVKDDKGGLKGLMVAGWSFRVYANRLDIVVKRNADDAAKKAGRTKVPLSYVFVVKGATAYGTPVSPDVNAEAVQKLDLATKTKAGLFRGQVEITGRTFGVAALKAPELGDDAAVAVLASEY